MTELQAQRFLRTLEDYFEAHGLIAEGTQRQWLLSSDERSLTKTDQVDLLDWLVAQPVVSEVLLMPLTARLHQPGMLADGFVALRTCELWTAALSLLYRCGRLTPELYLQVLGEFVRPVAR